jgi:hypothetical protein
VIDAKFECHDRRLLAIHFLCGYNYCRYRDNPRVEGTARGDDWTKAMTGRDGRNEDVRLRAWTDFVLSYNGLTAVLEREMQDETGITLSQYDVLLRLAEAPGGRLKMSDLAQAIVYSTGGLTRLFERMRRAGLVRREPSEHDRRPHRPRDGTAAGRVRGAPRRRAAALRRPARRRRGGRRGRIPRPPARKHADLRPQPVIAICEVRQ